MEARMDTDSGLQRVAKDETGGWELNHEQSRYADHTKRERETLVKFLSNHAGPSTAQRQTSRERLESRLEDFCKRGWTTNVAKRCFQEGSRTMATRLRRELKGVEDRLNGFEAW